MQVINQWHNPDGTIWLTIGKSQERFLLTFPGLAEFELDRKGDVIHRLPLGGCDTATMEHLYINQVVPLVLSLQRSIVLHASAVNILGCAVAFCGSSGMGKSTIAASFAIERYPFLTDDGLAIEKTTEGYMALPSHPAIRLWDDSRDTLFPNNTVASEVITYSPKAKLFAGPPLPFCGETLPLRCVFLLENRGVDSVCIEPVTGSETVMGLIGSSFLLDIADRSTLIRHFDSMIGFVGEPIFFSLDYPRNYDALPALIQSVVKHMAYLKSASC